MSEFGHKTRRFTPLHKCMVDNYPRKSNLWRARCRRVEKPNNSKDFRKQGVKWVDLFQQWKYWFRLLDGCILCNGQGIIIFRKSGEFIYHLSNNYFKGNLSMLNYVCTLQCENQYSQYGLEDTRKQFRSSIANRRKVQASPQHLDGLNGQSSLLIELEQGSFPQGQGGRVVNLTTYIHLVVKLRIPLTCTWIGASWCEETTLSCYELVAFWSTMACIFVVSASISE